MTEFKKGDLVRLTAAGELLASTSYRYKKEKVYPIKSIGIPAATYSILLTGIGHFVISIPNEYLILDQPCKTKAPSVKEEFLNGCEVFHVNEFIHNGPTGLAGIAVGMDGDHLVILSIIPAMGYKAMYLPNITTLNPMTLQMAKKIFAISEPIFGGKGDWGTASKEIKDRYIELAKSGITVCNTN